MDINRKDLLYEFNKYLDKDIIDDGSISSMTMYWLIATAQFLINRKIDKKDIKVEIRPDDTIIIGCKIKSDKYLYIKFSKWNIFYYRIYDKLIDDPDTADKYVEYTPGYSLNYVLNEYGIRK